MNLPKKEDDLKKIFLNELENNNENLSHISNELIFDKLSSTENSNDVENLNHIDRMYGIANKLSIENQKVYRKILFLLAAFGTLLVGFFLIYDSVNMHWVIGVCLIMIFCLGFSRWWADNSLCHRKYLEFRVLAESMRLQFFLSVAGIKTPVAEILPWFVKSGSPWIREILEDLKLPDISKPEKNYILNFWIRNQISYHEYNIRKTLDQKKRSEQISKLIRWATIFVYVFAGLFELYVFMNSPVAMDAEKLRMWLKIIVGVMSALSIFIDSFYGKKSLEDLINDSIRMKELYIKTEQKVMHEGNPEKALMDLAREFLIENSIWYAYQNQNKPDMVL